MVWGDSEEEREGIKEGFFSKGSLSRTPKIQCLVTSTKLDPASALVIRHCSFPATPAGDEIALSDTEGKLLSEYNEKLFPRYLWQTASRGTGIEIEWPDDVSEFVIVIIDTGIKKNNKVFLQSPGKILPESKSFVTKTIEDIDGHGTMCAAIAAGDVVDTADFKYSGGVAPNASLLICKVSNTKEFSLSIVIDALEYIEKVHEKKPVHVVSMSFGFPKRSPKLEWYINRLTLKGIICVGAAGNSGNTPGVPVRFPAAFDNCISIGAHNYSWKLADCCADPALAQHKIDFTTVGVDVCAPSLDDRKPLGAYSGTSVATAVAAGLVVGILQREFGKDLKANKLADVVKSLKKMTDDKNPIKLLWPAKTFTAEPELLF